MDQDGAHFACKKGFFLFKDFYIHLLNNHLRVSIFSTQKLYYVVDVINIMLYFGSCFSIANELYIFVQKKVLVALEDAGVFTSGGLVKDKVITVQNS